MKFAIQIELEDKTTLTLPHPEYDYTVDEADRSPLGAYCKSVKILRNGKLVANYTGQMVSVYIQRVEQN